MALTIKACFNDDSILNRRGFRVLSSGIDYSEFMLNPVVLLAHDSWRLSIGKVVRLWVKGSKLLGEIEFDEEDEEAKKVYKKYKGRFMNAFSMGIMALSFSKEPQYLLKGQTYETVTKSSLREVSCVTIPAVPNAVQFSFSIEGDETVYKNSVDLSVFESEGELIELSAHSITNPQKLIDMSLIKNEKILSLLESKGIKLADNATDEAVILALNTMKTEPEKKPETKTELNSGEDVQKLQEELANMRGQMVESLLQFHVSRGALVMGAENKNYELYKKLALSDYESTKAALELLPANESLASFTDTQSSEHKQDNSKVDQRFAAYGLVTLSDEEISKLPAHKKTMYRMAKKHDITKAKVTEQNGIKVYS